MSPIVSRAGFLGLGIMIVSLGEIQAQEPIRRIDPTPARGQSLATVVGDVPLVHTAQVFPKDPKAPVKDQCRDVIATIAESLATVESSLDKVVKFNAYVARDEDSAVVREVLTECFGASGLPAVAFVRGTLADASASVAADAVAVSSRRSGDVFISNDSRAAILPAGGKVYVAGQAENGELPEAARKTLESLSRTLKFLGLQDRDVVQVKAFMKPMGRAEEVRRVVRDHFGAGKVPPLVLVEWNLSQPVEIELIAASPARSAGPVLEFLTPPDMKASPIFSRVVRVNRGGLIYTSGLFGTSANDSKAQTDEILAALGDLLKRSGSDFRSLIKATYYVADETSSRRLNDVRPNFYDPLRPPSASKAGVAGTGESSKAITIDMIAAPSVPDR